MARLGIFDYYFDLSVMDATMQFVVIFSLFLLYYFLLNRFSLKLKYSRFLDEREYMPLEETQTLRQVWYLSMGSAAFIFILACFTTQTMNDFYLYLYDIILSSYVFLAMNRETLRDKILLFFLIPFGAISFLVTERITLLIFLDFIHMFAYVFVIKHYYRKFFEYTDSNGLGISILLLYVIVFFSMINTHFSENVNLLDALVMSSNAFTSNGYAVLGKSIPGKIDSIILVWGGYIISGVSTATLTSAILTKHFNKKFEQLEKKIEENNKN